MTKNTTTFPKDDSCIEDDFEADLQEEVGADLRVITSRISLKPCPFCGGEPEFCLARGYLVRCLCSSCLVISETVPSPTIEAAAIAWNRRASKCHFTVLKEHFPFALIFVGAFLFSVGAGLHFGVSAFLMGLGLFVGVSPVLNEMIDRSIKDSLDTKLESSTPNDEQKK